MKDPWRYRCPEGHCTWEPHQNHIVCRKCEQKYDKLVDWKTKQPVSR